MLTKEDIIKTIESADLDEPKIRIEDDVRGLLVFVTSNKFRGMENFKRQTYVWNKLIERFGYYDISRIQFIFTYAPEEIKHAS